MSLIESFLARPVAVEFDGRTLYLKRPTVAHLIAAQDAESRGEFMPAWYVLTHVVTSAGTPEFGSIEIVKELSAPLVLRLARLIEPLYVEGLDLPAPHAKS
jgi:hypothetical protein